MQTSLTDSEYISKTQGQAWCISEAEEPNEMYCCKQLREKIPHIVYNKVILSVDDLFLFSNLSCHCQRKCYFFPATTFFPQASGIGSFCLVSSLRLALLFRSFISAILTARQTIFKNIREFLQLQYTNIWCFYLEDTYFGKIQKEQFLTEL